jgi:hypothetical protein
MYALFAHGLEAITPPVPLFESIVNKLPDSRQESARTLFRNRAPTIEADTDLIVEEVAGCLILHASNLSLIAGELRRADDALTTEGRRVPREAAVVKAVAEQKDLLPFVEDPTMFSFPTDTNFMSELKKRVVDAFAAGLIPACPDNDNDKYFSLPDCLDGAYPPALATLVSPSFAAVVCFCCLRPCRLHRWQFF